jgi:hypothetical protein
VQGIWNDLRMLLKLAPARICIVRNSIYIENSLSLSKRRGARRKSSLVFSSLSGGGGGSWSICPVARPPPQVSFPIDRSIRYQVSYQFGCSRRFRSICTRGHEEVPFRVCCSCSCLFGSWLDDADYLACGWLGLSRVGISFQS